MAGATEEPDSELIRRAAVRFRTEDGRPIPATEPVGYHIFMVVSGRAQLHTPDFARTYVGESGGRSRILLIESDPMLGLDLADALEAAGLQTVGPLRRPAEALSLLPYLTMQAVVLGQERWDEAGRAILRRLRRWDVPVVVHAALPDERELAVELADVPILSRPAWASDVVAAVKPLLPVRSRP